MRDQLALDFSVLRRLAEGVAVQLPVFKDVSLQQYRGGLPTMTADGEHVIGAAPVGGFPTSHQRRDRTALSAGWLRRPARRPG
jgi:hypothetical protein